MPVINEHEALQRGALLLQFKVRPIRARIMVQVGPNLLHADATWAWPGVVTVTLCGSADVIAQSQPGRPFEPATAVALDDSLGNRLRRPASGDQAAALLVAARLLRYRETLPQQPLAPRGGGTHDQFAVWCWPGVVRIVRCDDGEVVAESVPGQPFEQSDRCGLRRGSSVAAQAARTLRLTGAFA